MNYIYDIVLNFHKNYYNFYEWNRTDKIKNIYKIPVYRVTDEDLNNFMYNKIKINKTIFIKDNTNKKNILLISNTKTTIGILTDEKGNIIKRSSLLFEEENEVNYIAKSLQITKIEYQKNIKNPPRKTLRIETEKKEHLKKYIKELTNKITLKYLYYEYFNEECEDVELIRIKLLEELDKEWNTKKTNLYKTINLLIKLPSK